MAVENFALVDRAPVANGFGLFTIEATQLLPAPRKRESFTPTEDEHFYTLRRTVERFLQRKEIPRGWNQSNEATFSFKNELARFPKADGIAYAVEGELALHGNKPIPVGVTLLAPPDGMILRYSIGIMAANQTLMMKEGVIEGPNRKVAWMLSLRPSGPDAAIPVRAVFAVRAEGGDEAAQRASLEGVSATLNASSDGRAAVAERANDASEWLKPMQVFLRPDQVTGKGGAKEGKEGKEEKKEKKGGH
ncbi:hypothetical protein CCC_02663 [Paramagnetospirillum magnetotacticum MS-1]|uniref:Uncharacterized protein n=1 Tax=Paramagnetospirillum magnetotacticum MS-1 TaxID=272627 RepID=A0A0C2YJB2_PARME|nr:hypothetical protein CCC_02663 [Paramagnetospirillum magnetotacticum MS-1]